MYKFDIPGPDAGANDKFQQFKTGFTSHYTDLGFEAPDLDNIIAAATDFNASLVASDAAKAAALNAVEFKNKKRDSSTEVFRDYVARIKTNPAATPAILTALGITPASSYAGPVVPPVELSASPEANGTCKLKWKRSTNSKGTLWLIESSDASGTWTSLATSTRTNYTDTSASPGVLKSYRVRAQRKGITSAPTASATIYDEGESFQLKVAA